MKEAFKGLGDAILKLVLIITIACLLIWYSGFVIAECWNWFLVPQGWGRISITVGVGIRLVVSVCQISQTLYLVRNEKSVETTWTDTFKQSVFTALAYTVVWSQGWILKEYVL